MAGGLTTIPTVRDALVVVLKTISGLKVYAYEPRDLDSLPALTLSPPRLERVGLDSPENRTGLGARDWRMFFTMRLYVALDDPEAGQDEAEQYVGAIAGALDTDQTLGNSPGVIDAQLLTVSHSFTAATEQRQMVIYEGELGVYREVT